MTFTVCRLPKTIALGYQGENQAREIAFDWGPWAKQYGAGVLSILLQRYGDGAPYPVTTETEGTVTAWMVGSADTAVVGMGKLQLNYAVGQVVVKSAVAQVLIEQSLGDGTEPPDPYESWIDTLTVLGGETQVNARAAAESETNAAASAEAAAVSERNAGTSQTNAAASAEAAAQSATNAATSKTGADMSASGAASAAQTAVTKSGEAAASAAASEAARVAAESARDTARDYRDTVVAVADGVSQESTAQEILSLMQDELESIQELIALNRSIRYYDELPEEGTEGCIYMTPGGTYRYHGGEYEILSGGGSLNGFSLTLNQSGQVVLGYVNPLDGTDTGSAVFPTDSTGREIVTVLSEINETIRGMIPETEEE